MALPARLGPYDIQAKLGAGGMGEVYRARDTKLGREVAIKVLPEVVAQDGEHLARFRREAQVLAALNHPHIAAIHGIEEAGGVHFLVLELVEGETLADRLRAGALPVSEAIAITRQICEAVASAHERGVIHRDLKPANIALTADDRVKVLDFGLARSAAPATADQRLAHSPTVTAAGVTAEGVILGTAPYMSPEQARGRVVDKRSDIFSLGCVFFEMLAGRRPFTGETVTETLANVLKSDPDWAALPGDLPPAVLEILRGALQKDRKDRIGDLSTVSFLLDRAGSTGTAGREVSPRRWRPLSWLAAGVVLGVLVAAGLLWQRPTDTAAQPVMRFTYQVPPEDRLILSRRAIALSPDGTRLAFTGARGLVIRPLSDANADLVPGTIGATLPIFAPDGQSLVFWHASALKRLAIGTASILTLAQVGVSPNHISWTGDRLFYAQGRGTILQVPASGGTPAAVLDLADSDDVPLGAQLLPDEDTLLYTTAKRSVGERPEADSLFMRSLRSGTSTPLLEFASDAAYLPSGHIVFARQGTLYAVPFELATRTLTGDPVPVLEGISRATTFTGAAASRSAQISVAAPGLLAYVAGPALTQNLDLALFDRSGAGERLDLPGGMYQFPRVSPDGTRVAVEVGGRESLVAIHDRAVPRSLRRLTFGGNNRYPTWSSNGQRIAFQSDREGDLAIFWQAVTGGAAERLTRPEPGIAHVPEAWTPDGQVLLFTAIKDSRSTLWTLSLKDRSMARFADVRDSYLPINPALSPDGRWVAYQFAEHAEQGEAVTFVEPFPPTGTKYEIGNGGRPAWSRDGMRLFIVPNPSQWFAFAFKARPEVAISSHSMIPRWFGVASPSLRRTFDLLPDGRVIAAAARDNATDEALQIQFVVNWFEELNTRAPAARRR